ncbi:MAG: glycoside hydrolase family 2 protein [Bacteroidales bacterium]|nr:glycoside hydrolase family 2 protein [Bacteroidales bacterium]
MQRIFTILSTFLLSTICVMALDLGGQNRQDISLNEGWGYHSIFEVAKKAPFEPVTLPHTWNVRFIPGTVRYDRAMNVYNRTLTITPEMQGKRLFLYFEGVNSVASVFINRHIVGEHKGGYLAFCYEITDFVKPGDNLLEVWASNAFRTDVLPISGDFNVYGGIHRPCHLIVTEQDCIRPDFYASPGVLIRQKNVSAKQAELDIETFLSLKSGRNLQLKAEVKDTDGNIVVANTIAAQGDVARIPLTLQNPHLWQGKQDPYLYTVEVSLMDGEKVIDQVRQQTGLRSFYVDPDQGFFLNGKHLDLVGFNRHDDFDGRGSALLPEHYQQDMALILESGATFMRLAHYPHNEEMYRLSDENGIVLWTEIPFCGPGGMAYTGFLDTPGFKENARQCARELMYQKFNHPSICFWAIFNEVLVDKDNFVGYDDPTEFFKEINAIYKSLDPSRLTTFATCVDTKLYLGIADLLAWNKYFGWYSDAVGQADKFFDNAKEEAAGTPVGVSEYGAGGSPNQHSWPLDNANKADGHFHPEEAQAVCHEGNWACFCKRPYLWCKTIWHFADIQSYQRKEGEKDGFNDKGLITYDRKIKKDAFWFYKANWNPEPMIYIASRRFTDRTEAQTDVRVYTNLKKVTLYINGKKIGTMKPDDIRRALFNGVTLQPGQNVIRVEGKNGKQLLSDQCIWNLN